MTNETIKVLVVEDLRVAQLAADNILTKLGCHVTIAASGAAAYQHLIGNHFDIIFIDIQLPDINGFNIAEIFRALERKNRTPLIAVTANSSEELAENVKRFGFDDYMLKPLSIESVRYILFKYLPPGKRKLSAT